MGWEPVLDGELAEGALQAVHDIARAIAARPPADEPACDRALYWAYTSAVVDEPFAIAAYERAVDDLVADLQRDAPHAGLFDGGLAGMAFALGHVLDGEVDGTLAAIDELLVRALDVERWPGHYDLTRGLVGFGVYFLERDTPLAHAGITRVVEHLARLATRDDAGARWYTPPALLHEAYRDDWPDGYVDCGLAHGAAGAIALLARASAVVDAARPLCDDAVRWLAAQRLASGRNRFPSKIAPGGTGEAPRTAWCYGDAGTAAALCMASTPLGLATALDCATRSEAACNLVDTGLCHGACGLAHILARIYQVCHDATIRDGARLWFARALAMRGDGGIAGFAQRVGDHDVPLAAICDGAMGVGLALLAASTANEPSWDRVQLVNVSARR